MVQVAPQPRSAPIQIGDYVARAGIYSKPGVITEKLSDGAVKIDTDASVIEQYHRHTNTSGLAPEEKERFNSIMDEVMKSDANGERINNLQQSIDSLKMEGGSRRVIDTLRNEQAQLIRLSHELPRVYQYDGDKLR